jgi:hypothetical protein
MAEAREPRGVQNPRPGDRPFFTAMSNLAAAEGIRLVVAVKPPEAGSSA